MYSAESKPSCAANASICSRESDRFTTGSHAAFRQQGVGVRRAAQVVVERAAAAEKRVFAQRAARNRAEIGKDRVGCVILARVGGEKLARKVFVAISALDGEHDGNLQIADFAPAGNLAMAMASSPVETLVAMPFCVAKSPMLMASVQARLRCRAWNGFLFTSTSE